MALSEFEASLPWKFGQLAHALKDVECQMIDRAQKLDHGDIIMIRQQDGRVRLGQVQRMTLTEFIRCHHLPRYRGRCAHAFQDLFVVDLGDQ